MTQHDTATSRTFLKATLHLVNTTHMNFRRGRAGKGRGSIPLIKAFHEFCSRFWTKERRGDVISSFQKYCKYPFKSDHSCGPLYFGFEVTWSSTWRNSVSKLEINSRSLSERDIGCPETTSPLSSRVIFSRSLGVLSLRDPGKVWPLSMLLPCTSFSLCLIVAYCLS